MIIHEWWTSTSMEGNMHKQCSMYGNLSTYITSISIRKIGNSITILIIYQRCITVISTIHQRECRHAFMIQYVWKIHASEIQWWKSVHASMIQHGGYFLYIYTQMRVSYKNLIQSQKYGNCIYKYLCYCRQLTNLDCKYLFLFSFLRSIHTTFYVEHWVVSLKSWQPERRCSNNFFYVNFIVLS